MGKRIDWEQVDELVEKIKEQGLSLAEGARQFDIPIRRLYEFNRRQKQTGGKSGPGPEASVGQAESKGSPIRPRTNIRDTRGNYDIQIF